VNEVDKCRKSMRGEGNSYWREQEQVSTWNVGRRAIKYSWIWKRMEKAQTHGQPWTCLPCKMGHTLGMKTTSRMARHKERQI
jgi:hypothetical protein